MNEKEKSSSTFFVADSLDYPYYETEKDVVEMFAMLKLHVMRNTLKTYYTGIRFGIKLALRSLVKDGRLTQETADDLRASIKKAFEDDLAERRKVAQQMLDKRKKIAEVIQETGLVEQEVALLLYGNGYDPEKPLHTTKEELVMDNGPDKLPSWI
jgi:hypothetical protein